jgi:hypothetical protein
VIDSEAVKGTNLQFDIEPDISGLARRSAPCRQGHASAGRAIHYMFKRWNDLAGFLQDGHLPANNLTRRTLRGLTLGKKVRALC